MALSYQSQVFEAAADAHQSAAFDFSDLTSSTLQCTLHNPHCTIHTTQCTMHNPRCTAFTRISFTAHWFCTNPLQCSAYKKQRFIGAPESTRKYKIKDPSEDKNGNDFRFWEAQGDTIWWKIVLHRPHSTYVKNVGQIFIFWISLLALTQGFQMPFMCFICTCHRLHQAGTIRGETSKPDLIQNSILKVHMLRFLHLNCRKSSLASLSLFETTKILKNWRNKFGKKCPNAVCRIVQFVPPWSL